MAFGSWLLGPGLPTCEGVEVRDFKDLRVWQSSHELALELYRASLKFPRQEMYGLTNQLRRAASSVGANLAEGCGRQTDAEMGRFVRIAMGSASELEYHLLLARDLQYFDGETWKRLQARLTSVRKMLAAFLLTLEAAAATKTSTGSKRARGNSAGS